MKKVSLTALLIITLLAACTKKSEESNVIELLIPNESYLLLEGNEVDFDSFESEFLELYDKKVDKVELPIIVDFRVAESVKMQNVTVVMKIIQGLENIKLEFSKYEHEQDVVDRTT